MNNETRLSSQYVERLEKFADICTKIYIARNISLRENDLLDALKEVDILLREKSEN